MTLTRIKPAATCWICRAYEAAPDQPVEASWLPEGWRRTRRGYAGRVTICRACNEAGRRYQRHRGEPTMATREMLIHPDGEHYFRIEVWEDRNGTRSKLTARRSSPQDLARQKDRIMRQFRVPPDSVRDVVPEAPDAA